MTSNPALSIVLFEPRIPQNTGNIARTCAAFQIPLILIKPLGFSLNDRYLKRAGLDYWPLVDLSIYENFKDFSNNLSSQQRIIGASKHKGVSLLSSKFHLGDHLLFGREDTGLPETVKEQCFQITTIPMPGKKIDEHTHGVRSLNLSVACSIVLFEAGKQLNLWI